MSSAIPAPHSRTIDRTSPLPYYHQLKHLLIQRVADERLAGGERFWSENELCQTYGLSRSVVRQALGELEAEGMIQRLRGKGTFLCRSKEDQGLVRSAGGLHDLAMATGRSLTSRVLRQEIVPAGDLVADALGLVEDAPVVTIERVRSVDGEPWALTTTWLSAQRFPGMESVDFSSGSLYGHLREQWGVRFGEARRTIEAAAASRHVAKHLGVLEGSPVLLLRSTIQDVEGVPVETFIAHHRGDRSRFDVILNGAVDSALMRNTADGAAATGLV